MKKILLLLSLLCLSNIQAKKFLDLKIMRLACPSTCSGERATYFVFEKYLIYNDDMSLEDIEPIIISWCKESPTLCSYMNGMHVSEEDYDNEQEDEDGYDNDPDIDVTSLGEEILSILGDYLDELSGTRSLNITNDDELVKQIQEFQNSEDNIELKRLYEIEKKLQERLNDSVPKLTYLDIFTNKLRAFTHYQSSLTSSQAARCQEIIKTLKKIGIAQTLSDDAIDLLAQVIKNNECLTSNNNKIFNFDNTYTVKEIIQTERSLTKERIAIFQKLLAIYE